LTRSEDIAPVPASGEEFAGEDMAKRKKAWQEFAANRVIVDSFNHFSSLLNKDKGQNLRRLGLTMASSSASSSAGSPKKPLSASSVLLPLPSSSSLAMGLPDTPSASLVAGGSGANDSSGTNEGEVLMRERSTVIKRRVVGPDGSEIVVSKDAKYSIVPHEEQMFICFTTDAVMLQHVESILGSAGRA
jgi:hypothetical protein